MEPTSWILLGTTVVFAGLYLFEQRRREADRRAATAERKTLLDRIMAKDLTDFKLGMRLEHPVKTQQIISDEDEAIIDEALRAEEERDESESESRS